MKDYKQLKKDFEAKVTKLQKACKHTKFEWYDYCYRVGAYAGYQIKICLCCNKELTQKPTREERKEIRRKWLDDNMSNKLKKMCKK